MRSLHTLTVALLLVMIPVTCQSRTWYIKLDGTGDAPTIQAGVDSAQDGDDVLVAAGDPVSDGIDWNGIPDINALVKIRVVDIANANVKADTPDSFKIVGGITDIVPSGAATTWAALSTTNEIAWSFNGSINPVKIYYDDDGGNNGYNGNTPIYTVAQSGTGSAMTKVKRITTSSITS